MDDEKLGDYVRQCADLMGLRDWTIFTSSDPAEEPDDGFDDARCATFAGTFGRKGAAVWVNHEWWAGATRDQRRQTIAHELVHAHLHIARSTVATILGGLCTTKKQQETLQALYDQQEEYAVDALADVAAKTLPLPPRDLK